jgi:hypothetical protein
MLRRWFRHVGTSPRLKAPFLLQAGAAFAGLSAVVGALTVLAMLAIASFSTGPFTWNDRPVSRAQFLGYLPLFLLVFSVPVVYFGVIALGVWRERSWTRHAVLAMWLIVAADLIGQGFAGELGLATALGWSSVYLATVGWYFYGKANVVAYYRALESRERGGEPPGASVLPDGQSAPT